MHVNQSLIPFIQVRDLISSHSYSYFSLEISEPSHQLLLCSLPQVYHVILHPLKQILKCGICCSDFTTLVPMYDGASFSVADLLNIPTANMKVFFFSFYGSLLLISSLFLSSITLSWFVTFSFLFLVFTTFG